MVETPRTREENWAGARCYGCFGFYGWRDFLEKKTNNIGIPTTIGVFPKTDFGRESSVTGFFFLEYYTTFSIVALTINVQNEQQNKKQNVN